MMFVFDTERTLLAEVDLQDGALRQVVLTAAGEKALGAHVSFWQTRGIPVAHSIETTSSEGAHDIATYFQYVQPRDRAFRSALEKWSMERGYCPVEVPDRLLSLWESLARMPLSRSERFAILLAIRLSPPETLVEWKSCLDEAEHAWHREREKSLVAIERIKKGMGQQLAKPFAGKV
ncbi:MAG: hypothetical protein AAB668_04055 [Patescibacteria group bacterium]